ncbi:MAG: Fe(2+)-trafficking protein [Nitrospirales bacterium]
MPQIHCRKCDTDAEMMTENLFLGKLEEEVKKNVCGTCWEEWNKPGGVKTMVINEYRLNLGDENARTTLKNQMRTFFKLDGAETEFKDYRT